LKLTDPYLEYKDAVTYDGVDTIVTSGPVPAVGDWLVLGNLGENLPPVETRFGFIGRDRWGI
jgi:hypothetical protein